MPQFRLGYAMIYTISHFQGTGETWKSACRGKLETAKATAVAAVEQGKADRTEVRDINGRLVFSYAQQLRA